MPPTPSAQITLSVSRTAGIVAVVAGEQYLRARTALETSGFQSRSRAPTPRPRQRPPGRPAPPPAPGRRKTP